MKLIELGLNKKSIGGGSQGKFYVLDDSLGVKLYRGYYGNQKSCQESIEMEMALFEADMLRRVEGCGRTPKYAEAVMIKRGHRYHMGILQEYLPHPTLYKKWKQYEDHEYVTSGGRYSANKRATFKSTSEWVECLLKPFGVDQGDSFCANLLIDKQKRLYIIDFGRAMTISSTGDDQKNHIKPLT